jgi:hypothetical protein
VFYLVNGILKLSKSIRHFGGGGKYGQLLQRIDKAEELAVGGIGGG